VLLACEAGERESKESWCELLCDLKARGLKLPRLTVADGHMVPKVHPSNLRQQSHLNHPLVSRPVFWAGYGN
jgi:transposase-like protein